MSNFIWKGIIRFSKSVIHPSFEQFLNLLRIKPELTRKHHSLLKECNLIQIFTFQNVPSKNVFLYFVRHILNFLYNLFHFIIFPKVSSWTKFWAYFVPILCKKTNSRINQQNLITKPKFYPFEFVNWLNNLHSKRVLTLIFNSKSTHQFYQILT